MTGRLDGRVALLIGAARGIGEAIAERFVEEGAKIIIGDREAEVGAAAAARLGGAFLKVDAASAEDIDRAVALALERHGRLDIALHNAGIYPWTLIEDITPEEWDDVLAVNLKGAFLLARVAVKPMKAQGGGRILYTSSITGPKVSSPGHAHYSASKAGINGFIRTAAIEFAPHNVTVNAVEPGNILTEGMKAHRSREFIAGMEKAVPLGRLGAPRDVANAFLFLASDDAAYVTGETIVVDGGQILPESGDFRITPS